MSEIPQYAIIGSQSGAGTLTMKDGTPLEVVALRLTLQPFDSDDVAIAVLTVLAREDAEALISHLQVTCEQVAYVSDQTPNNKEDISQ